jgi:hypothetical protein
MKSLVEALARALKEEQTQTERQAYFETGILF